MNTEYVFIVTRGQKGKNTVWARETLELTAQIHPQSLPPLVEPCKLEFARKQILGRLANYGRHIAYLAFLQQMVDKYGIEAIFL
jgi:hypothetical protein